ncbi:MAG: hypothetical protein R3C99_18025 [Pirellulaceae bacterium]
MNPENTPSPQVKPLGPAVEVPVYNCIVLVGPGETSGVRARVANLAGIETTARTEPRSPATTHSGIQTTIERSSHQWREHPLARSSPSPADAGEQQRLIAVHL